MRQNFDECIPSKYCFIQNGQRIGKFKALAGKFDSLEGKSSAMSRSLKIETMERNLNNCAATSA